jgi:hypothetical protein
VAATLFKAAEVLSLHKFEVSYGTHSYWLSVAARDALQVNTGDENALERAVQKAVTVNTTGEIDNPTVPRRAKRWKNWW